MEDISFDQYFRCVAPLGWEKNGPETHPKEFVILRVTVLPCGTTAAAHRGLGYDPVKQIRS